MFLVVDCFFSVVNPTSVRQIKSTSLLILRLGSMVLIGAAVKQVYKKKRVEKKEEP